MWSEAEARSRVRGGGGGAERVRGWTLECVVELPSVEHEAEAARRGAPAGVAGRSSHISLLKQS